MAIRDIIENSELKQLLEFDLSSQSIRFRSEVTCTEKRLVSDLLDSRSSTLAD
jgi:hypothetical protein